MFPGRSTHRRHQKMIYKCPGNPGHFYWIKKRLQEFYFQEECPIFAAGKNRRFIRIFAFEYRTI